MKKRVGRSFHGGLSRREVLLGGLAAAVTPRATAKDALTPELDVPIAPKTIGVRTIDIHAHYYPQAYFDLFVSEGQRFDAEYHTSEQGFFFKTRAESDGPLPTKFIDLKERLADMDVRGVDVHALSLRRIEPLHLLAAVFTEESNQYAKLLQDFGITKEQVLKRLKERRPNGDE